MALSVALLGYQHPGGGDLVCVVMVVWFPSGNVIPLAQQVTKCLWSIDHRASYVRTYQCVVSECDRFGGSTYFVSLCKTLASTSSFLVNYEHSISLPLSPPLPCLSLSLCPVCRHFIWDIMDLVIQIAVTMYSKVGCPHFSFKFTRWCALNQAAVVKCIWDIINMHACCHCCPVCRRALTSRSERRNLHNIQ